MKFKTILAAALIVVAPVTSAFAATLYDGSIHDSSATTRAAGNTPLGSFTAAADTLISRFAVGVDLNGTSTVNFVIFDQTNAVAFETGAIAGVADDAGFNDIFSPIINFTMLAGEVYRFGMTSSTGGLYQYGGGATTQNGITSSRNGNATGLVTPVFRGLAGAQMNVTLEGGTPPPVPLPASFGFLAAGALGFGFVRSRRKA